MSKKHTSATNSYGFVYSTNPDFNLETGDNTPASSLPADQQKLKIRLDTKHRAGKSVTLIEGFKGTVEDLEQLGKSLKNHCGTGGSAKDNEIIIQGDQRDRVLQWLLKQGYKQTKKM
ncbi:MAG TPA: translation initiation factor [Panacibacter sp.]|nr:translation initiation factor [Panacibacter sp.]HNP43043.1 translation initiation factor [Panacibacter sp.]